MKKFLKIPGAALATALLFAAPAMAQGVNVGVGVNAGSTSIINGGDSFSNGGVSVAMCTGAFNTPIFGVGWTERDCIEWNMAKEALQLGLITKETATQVYVSLSEVVSFPEPSPTLSTMTAPATASAPAPAPRSATVAEGTVEVPKGFIHVLTDAGKKRWLRTDVTKTAFLAGQTVRFPNGEIAIQQIK